MWRAGGEGGLHTDSPPIHPHSKDANLNNQGVREVPERAKIFFSSVQFSSVAQSCLTLCDPRDRSLPGSSIHGVFQARVLERVAMSYSRGS